VAKAVHDTRNRDETKPLNDLHTGKALFRVEGGFLFQDFFQGNSVEKLLFSSAL